MARPTPDPLFGAGFDATAFRAAIRNAMVMGLPNATAEKATFRWTAVKTFADDDPAGKPYSWTSSPTTTTTHADVQVPVAWEFSARPAASLDTTIGQFDASRVEITILDVDYEDVEGADQVLMGQNTYNIEFIAPPQGLFEVTVYKIYAVAQDES